MLIGISTMLAIKLEEPAVMVSESEMDAWLKAAQNVARHYSVETTQKTLDIVAFAGVSLQVFGTRAVAITAKNKKRKKGVGQDGNVLDAAHMFQNVDAFAAGFEGTEP